MRYGTDHKEQTRSRVVAAAARAMRARGPDQVAVTEIMAQVGLTHGGFYAHFPSKDSLVGAAIEAAFEQSRERVLGMSPDQSPGETLRRFINTYVSAEHRDRPELGCPIALLSSYIPGQAAPARAAYDRGTKGLIGLIATGLSGLGADDARDQAMSLLAEMAGAVALARAIHDRALSDRLLGQCRRNILARAGLHSRPREARST